MPYGKPLFCDGQQAVGQSSAFMRLSRAPAVSDLLLPRLPRTGVDPRERTRYDNDDSCHKDEATMIYHITSRASWQAALQEGIYRPPSLAQEGFIHFSTKSQLLMVANAFYRGQTDLVILCLPEARVAEALRWEAPEHPDPNRAPTNAQQERFPHLHAPLAAIDVAQVVAFPPAPDGSFVWPSGLPLDD